MRERPGRFGRAFCVVFGMKLGAADGYGSGIGAASDEGWRDVCASCYIHDASTDCYATPTTNPQELRKFCAGLVAAIMKWNIARYKSHGF